MAALTNNRPATVERNSPALYRHPVKGGVHIYSGALVALDAAGVAVPATTSTVLRGAGRAQEEVDNSTGADGAVGITVKRGVFLWAGDGVTRAHIGLPAYAVDDQTVSASDGAAGEDPATRSAVGIIRDVDAAGVWVEI